MNTKVMKSMAFTLITLLLVFSSAWGAETKRMPMPWDDWLDDLWNMMGGSSVRQFRAADLDGDHESEIVTIYGGIYLVIYENDGTVKTIKDLPNILNLNSQGGANQSGMPGGGGGMMGSSLDVADFDGDGDLEIMTIYEGGVFYGTYLVVLDSDGDLEKTILLQSLYNVNK